MANPLQLTLVSPDKVLFEGDVQYVSVPGGAGYFGVLVGHAPTIASLVPGDVEIRPVEGAPIKFRISAPGFFEVADNKVSILLDAADSAVYQQPAAPAFF